MSDETPGQLTLGAADAAPAEAPETQLQLVQRFKENILNVKDFALAKVDGMEARIKAVGGEVPADLAAAIADLREVAKP